MSEVYLDGNAGMRLRPAARAAIAAALDATPGNPSAAHGAGRRVRRLLSEARESVAALVGARPSEVVFTSGATEANLLAIRGALAAAPRDRRTLVVTDAEHDSVLRFAAHAASGGLDVRRVRPAADGRIAAADVLARCDAAVAVVSCGLAQSVTGAVQPVGDVARGLPPGIVLHTDAAQAPGRIACDVAALGAHLASLSAAKIGGPAGIGALVVREGARWTPPDGPTSQESGRRPGTEAVALAAGFGAAAREAAAERERFADDATRRTSQILDIVRGIDGGRVVGPAADRLPNTVLVAFDGCRGDALLAALDARGVCVSTGSACASGARAPAAVLLAAGVEPAEAALAVRISTCWSTSDDDLDALAAALADVVPRVRSALATS